MEKKRCAICGAEIPDKDIDTLTELGYARLLVESEPTKDVIQGFGIEGRHKKVVGDKWYCPNHTQDEILSNVYDFFQRKVKGMAGCVPPGLKSRWDAVELIEKKKMEENECQLNRAGTS